MSYEISLIQAAEKAEQVEVLMLMLSRCADNLVESEIQAVAKLAASLAGNVAYRLYEEPSVQESGNE